eukprot:scaffold112549_cov21-Tisochrysis_lutea.AAC.2
MQCDPPCGLGHHAGAVWDRGQGLTKHGPTHPIPHHATRPTLQVLGTEVEALWGPDPPNPITTTLCIEVRRLAKLTLPLCLWCFSLFKEIDADSCLQNELSEQQQSEQQRIPQTPSSARGRSRRPALLAQVDGVLQPEEFPDVQFGKSGGGSSSSWYVTGVPPAACMGKWHLGWRRQAVSKSGRLCFVLQGALQSAG